MEPMESNYALVAMTHLSYMYVAHVAYNQVREKIEKYTLIITVTSYSYILFSNTYLLTDLYYITERKSKLLNKTGLLKCSLSFAEHYICPLYEEQVYV